MTNDLTPEQRAELIEVFLFAYQQAGFEAAVEAVARATIPAVTAPHAIRLVCRFFGVAVEQLLTGDTREAWNMRDIAMWLLRQHGMPWPRMTLKAIAEAMGRKSHDVAFDGIRRVERKAELLEVAKRLQAVAVGRAI